MENIMDDFSFDAVVKNIDEVYGEPNKQEEEKYEKVIKDLRKKIDDLYTRVFDTVNQSELYHYTSEESANKIISDKYFYATRKDRLVEMNYVKPLLHSLPNDKNKDISSRIRILVNGKIPYSLSFCDKKDNDYLKERYGNAIIRVKTQSILNDSFVQGNKGRCSWHIGKVIYDKDEQQEIIQEWLSIYNELLDKMPKMPMNRIVMTFINMQYEIETYFLATLDFIKAPKFAPEQEVKVVYTDSARLCQGTVKDKNGEDKPVVKICGIEMEVLPLAENEITESEIIKSIENKIISIGYKNLDDEGFAFILKDCRDVSIRFWETQDVVTVKFELPKGEYSKIKNTLYPKVPVSIYTTVDKKIQLFANLKYQRK